MQALAIIGIRARKHRHFLLGLADGEACLVLTSSATVLANGGSCPYGCQRDFGCGKLLDVDTASDLLAALLALPAPSLLQKRLTALIGPC